MKNKIQRISKIVIGGLSSAILGVAHIALAQTSTTTPGVPTTGLAGSSILNVSLLILASILVVIGLVSLLNSKQYSL